jgi:hypothetical protein
MKIAGAIENIQTIAERHGIRELGILRQTYGDGNWKKKKGVAMVETDTGHIAKAEVHCMRLMALVR